jgi:hypothetical protein
MLQYKDNIMECKIGNKKVEAVFCECDISKLQNITHIKSIIELFLHKQLHHETFEQNEQNGYKLEFRTKFVKIDDYYRPFMQIDLKTHKYNVCFTVSLRQTYQLRDVLNKCVVNIKP